MPVAVIVNALSDKKDLKSCPGGFVIVRRMNYGEKLYRNNIATRMLMSANKDSKDFQGELDMQTEEVAYWEFANLIVEHNLTDEKEQPLNFKNRDHVRRLAGPVGDEIGQIIDEWNAAEETEEVKNS